MWLEEVTRRPTKRAIRNALSDNEPVRKRGRPPLMPKAERAAFAQAAPDVSERTLQNRFHGARAFLVLNNAPAGSDYRFLTANGGRGRAVLLAALGRLEHPALIRRAAQILCERRPSCREGLALVRKFRRELEGQ